MTAHLIIILIVVLLGNTAIAATFDQPRLTGLLWTLSEVVIIALLWGTYTILTA
jgi:hypothetical protein